MKRDPDPMGSIAARPGRRGAIARLAALGCAVMVPAARAQLPKVPRVATLTYGSPYNAKSRSEAFVKGMRELGYEDGRNVQYEWRSANGQPDLLRELAMLLAQEKVDVIVSASTVTTAAILQATKSIPVVMTAAEDPVASGFARSLARPDGNVTGITTGVLDQISRQMELLAKVVPGLSMAAALVNPANVTYAAYRSRLEASAKASRVSLVMADATLPGEIERAFQRFASRGARGLLVMSDGFFYNERSSITELAARFRLPAVYPNHGYSDSGGLMSYGPNLEYNYFRAATFVDKILKGARPGDLPIEQPANHDLVINRGVARSIGFALPNDLLKRAQKVIG
jgi:putative tryptophan/tyrosine transport system substrate-binding protein